MSYALNFRMALGSPWPKSYTFSGFLTLKGKLKPSNVTAVKSLRNSGELVSVYTMQYDWFVAFPAWVLYCLYCFSRSRLRAISFCFLSSSCSKS